MKIEKEQIGIPFFMSMIEQQRFCGVLKCFALDKTIKDRRTLFIETINLNLILLVGNS